MSSLLQKAAAEAGSLGQALQHLECLVMHLSERAAAPPGEVRSCGASNAALSDFEVDLAVRLLLNLLQQTIQALGVSNDAGLCGFLRRVLHLCGRFCAWPRFKRELMRGRIVGQLQPVLAARHPPICHLHALQKFPHSRGR